MKQLSSLIILLSFLLSSNLNAQKSFSKEQYSESITKTYTPNKSQNLFSIHNVAGTIDVKGYEGNTIQVIIEKDISASTKELLNQGIKEIKIGEEINDKEISLYLDAPFNDFDTKSKNMHVNRNCNSNSTYNYSLNYTVKVPLNMNIHLQNVSGEYVKLNNIDAQSIVVKNVSGHVNVENLKASEMELNTVSGHLNGSNLTAQNLDAYTTSGHVNLSKVNAVTRAHTISGHVNVDFINSPDRSSSFSTLSGNINLDFPSNLNAQVNYLVKLSGNFYTDFDSDYSENKKQSNSYNNSCSPKNSLGAQGKSGNLKIGKGGSDLNVTTHSGNIYIRKS